MKIPELHWQAWVLVAIVGAVVGVGIWAFGVAKPPRLIELQIGLRLIDEERAEIGLRETDHLGQVHVYQAEGPELDFSLVNRPRSQYSEPVLLSNDTRNAPSRARITQRKVSDEEVKLGLRVLRPSRTWDSTRFPRPDPIRVEELSADEWFYYPPLQIRVTYHQPLVDVVRVFVYIAGAFAVLLALSWVVWRKWMS